MQIQSINNNIKIKILNKKQKVNLCKNLILMKRKNFKSWNLKMILLKNYIKKIQKNKK